MAVIDVLRVRPCFDSPGIRSLPEYYSLKVSISRIKRHDMLEIYC